MDSRYGISDKRKYRVRLNITNERTYLCENCGYVGRRGSREGILLEKAVCRSCMASSSYLYCVEPAKLIEQLAPTLAESIDAALNNGLYADEEKLLPLLDNPEKFMDYAKDVTKYINEKMFKEIDDSNFQREYWSYINPTDVEALQEDIKRIRWIESAAWKDDYEVAGWAFLQTDPEIKSWILKNKIGLEYIVYYSDDYVVTNKNLYVCEGGKVKNKYAFASQCLIPVQGKVQVRRTLINGYIVIENEKPRVEVPNNTDVMKLLSVPISLVRYGYIQEGDLGKTAGNTFCQNCGMVYNDEKKCPYCKGKVEEYGWTMHWNYSKYISGVKQVPSAIEKNIEKELEFCFELVTQYFDRNRKEDANDTDKLETCVEQSTQEETMFCPFCGKQIKRSANFCNFCGKQNNYGK